MSRLDSKDLLKMAYPLSNIANQKRAYGYFAMVLEDENESATVNKKFKSPQLQVEAQFATPAQSWQSRGPCRASVILFRASVTLAVNSCGLSGPDTKVV
jgi:hypothetical protein